MTPDHGTYERLSSYEGCSLTPYYDIAGDPTIGKGNRWYPEGTPVRITDKAITQEYAEQIFEFAINKVSDWLNANLPKTKPVTNNQFQAMLSFFYNIGTSGFFIRYPHTGTAFLAGNWVQFALLMKDFIHAGGHFSQGLYNRRVKEVELFNTPDN